MAHYIDADKLKTEIERRIKILREDEIVRQNCSKDFLEGKIYGYEESVSFLSSLESEKSMNQKGLEREIERCLWQLSDDPSNEELRMFALHFYDLGCRRTAEKYDEIEYNRQRAEETVCDELEKEIEKFLNETGAPYYWCNDDEQKEWCSIIARHFAQWGVEHLADDRKTSGGSSEIPKDLEEAAEDFGKRQGLELRPFANKFFIAGAEWDREQMMKELPKWKKIKAGERLPCPAYVWTIAYDNYPDWFEGRLMPNIEGVKVGHDTWYLPVDVIHNLPKEDEK